MLSLTEFDTKTYHGLRMTINKLRIELMEGSLSFQDCTNYNYNEIESDSTDLTFKQLEIWVQPFMIIHHLIDLRRVKRLQSNSID